VIVRSEDAMLDQWANVEVTQHGAERFLVVALVCGESEQIARVPAGDLLTEVGITSFSGGRAMHVKEACVSVSTSFVTFSFCTR